MGFEMSIIQNRLKHASEEIEHLDDYLRMYIILVKELEMSPGKMAAQSAHIAQETILLADADTVATYRGNGMGTKLVMRGARNKVFQIAEIAHNNNIICGIGCDRGHIILPHFDGSPTITGIGLLMTREQSHDYIKYFSFINQNNK